MYLEAVFTLIDPDGGPESRLEGKSHAINDRKKYCSGCLAINFKEALLKAAYFHGVRDIRVGEFAEAAPGPGEVLLDVTAVGICGSDLHNYLFGQIGDTVIGGPLVLGHEAAGRIAALGPGTDKAFYVGQSVAIDPAIHCGVCERCEEGNPNLCINVKFMGLWPQHGALREQMIHPASACIPLPESIGPVAGALLEPLGVALHAIRLAKIKLGDDVLITGCGAIGLLLIRLAKLSGARCVMASEKHLWRLEMAKRFGADEVIDTSQTDVVDYVNHATENRGVDVAIESAWVTDTVNQCVDAARNGGRVIIVGIPAEDMFSVRSSASRRKGLTIKLSRRMKHTYPAAISLADKQQVMLDLLATHRFTLDQSPQAFETAATYVDGVIRAMIIPVSDRA